MPDLDPSALRAQAPLLGQETLSEMLAAGAQNYSDEVWQILQTEMTRRSAALESGEEVIVDPHHAAPEGPVVRVFSGTSANQLTMAKLLLDGEGIPYVTTGEGVQDLFGIGRLFGGTNLITGPVHLAVAQNQASRALEVLASLEA